MCQQVPINRHKLPPDKSTNSTLDRRANATPARIVGRMRTATSRSSPHYSGHIIKPVLKVNLAPSNSPRQYNSRVFEGECVDTGAQKSFCGLAQARVYCLARNKPFYLTPSPYSFKFGDGVRTSVGRMEVRMRVREGFYLPFQIDVVDADVPLLIGLDLLDLHQLIVDKVDNVLVSKSSGWKIPIARIHGHLFVQWDLHAVMFTRTELERLHLHFFHPSK